jgi:hypothetical protein
MLCIAHVNTVGICERVSISVFSIRHLSPTEASLSVNGYAMIVVVAVDMIGYSSGRIRLQSTMLPNV